MEGPKTHEVAILVGRKFCEIEPGDLFLRNGDRVVFINQTGARVVLYFGNRALFDRELLEMKGDGPSEPLVLRPNPPPRSFQYVVYSERTGTFGVGGSSPRIIVMQ
jgi:hypothetical protein